jgi:hypothetical protein
MQTTTQEEIFEEIMALENIYVEKLLKIFPKGYNRNELFFEGIGPAKVGHGIPLTTKSLRGEWRVLQLLDLYPDIEVAKKVLRDFIAYDAQKIKTDKAPERIFSFSGKKVFVSEQIGDEDSLKIKLLKMLIHFREEEGIFFPSLIMSKFDETRIFFYSPKTGEFKRIRHYDE